MFLVREFPNVMTSHRAYLGNPKSGGFFPSAMAQRFTNIFNIFLFSDLYMSN